MSLAYRLGTQVERIVVKKLNVIERHNFTTKELNRAVSFRNTKRASRVQKHKPGESRSETQTGRVAFRNTTGLVAFRN